MKVKSLLTSLSLVVVAFGASSATHNYYWKVSQAELDAFNLTTTEPLALTPWYTPNLIMPLHGETELYPESSNVYKDNTSDMLVRSSKITDTSDKKYAYTLSGALMEGAIDDKGVYNATVPSILTHPYVDDAPAAIPNEYTDGVALFHLTMGGKPNRINDAANTLSSTGDRCYLSDINGVYIGVNAPAGAKVVVYFSTPEAKASSVSASGLHSSSAYDGSKIHTLYYEFPTLTTGGYTEMQVSGTPKGCLIGASYTGSSWADGYCVKFIDIAIYNVKAGDKVGVSGLQSLYIGYTPTEFVPDWAAGINNVTVDESNAPVEYYNLQGVRVENPSNGLYIQRQGSKCTKTYVR